MNSELIFTGIAVLGFLGGLARWLIAAWGKALAAQANSPSNTSVIVDASVDVVDVLRAELSRIQIELNTVRRLLEQVQQERDEWRQRAIDLGWK